MTTLDTLLDRVRAERARQDELHGTELDLPLNTLERGWVEAYLAHHRRGIAYATDHDELDFTTLLSCEVWEAAATGSPDDAVTELVQVAALALKAAEAVLWQEAQR